MHTNILKIFSAAFVCFLVGCTQQESASEKLSKKQADINNACKFGTSTAPGPFCAASIFSLIANPKNYYGKNVYTYGYLRVSKGGDTGLGYESESRALPDFFSCIDLENPKLSVGEGVYSVAVFGRFTASSNNICAGRIEAPTIDTIEREQD